MRICNREIKNSHWVLCMTAIFFISSIIIFGVSLAESNAMVLINNTIPYTSLALILSSFLCILSFIPMVSIYIIWEQKLWHNKKYLIILIAVFATAVALQLALSIWAACANIKPNDEDFEKSLKDMLFSNGKNEDFWYGLHKVERKFSCCAYTGYKDYYTSGFPRALGSCCGQELYDYCPEDKAYPGCIPILKIEPQKTLTILAIVGCIFTTIEIISFVISVLIVTKIQKDQVADNSAPRSFGILTID